jgi:phospholipase/carboxylesterase
MNVSIIIQTPAEPSQQLFLLFHGVGADPTDLAPLGKQIAQAFPAATVVSVAAPDECDMGKGLQWMSVQGATEAEREAKRPERLALALPRFISTVKHWQALAKVEPSATALIGFSQGGIMALEASKGGGLLAGRVMAHSARFVTLPSSMSELTSIHLIHGKDDAVIPYRHTVEAAEALQALKADFTADVLPHLGHSMNADSIALIFKRLQSHVPKRLWDEALQAAKHL